MVKVFAMSTKVWEYEDKDKKIEGIYAEFGRVAITDDWKMFWEVFDTFNSRTIKFDCFEMKKREKQDSDDWLMSL